MDSKKPYVALFIVQSLYAGLAILSKLAFNGGMNTFVFVFYRQALATLVLLPSAFIFERKTAPPMTGRLLTKIFFLALLGITICLNVYNIAIKYTSAPVGAAATNMIPVLTFFLSVLLGMEVLKLKTVSGMIKILGITVCAAGVLVIALYGGPHLKSLSHHQIIDGKNNGTYSKQRWVIGTLLMIVATILWAVLITFQGVILREYPSTLLFATISSIFSTIQCFLIAVPFARNFREWKLHFDEGLLAVIYSGLFVAGIAYYLQAWCIGEKGPVFMAMSTPVNLAVTIACSSFILGQSINLGSVLGGILLVGGLYCVLWGKSQEKINPNPDAEAVITEPQHSKDSIQPPASSTVVS